MPRIARPFFPGIPNHITQRGNRREDVFFSDADRAAYLVWLEEYCALYDVAVLAYCLMTNHVHVVAIPGRQDSLEKLFRALHTRYARRINREKNWSGHLWQGRFFPRRWTRPIYGRRYAMSSAIRCVPFYWQPPFLTLFSSYSPTLHR